MSEFEDGLLGFGVGFDEVVWMMVVFDVELGWMCE